MRTIRNFARGIVSFGIIAGCFGNAYAQQPGWPQRSGTVRAGGSGVGYITSSDPVDAWNGRRYDEWYLAVRADYRYCVNVTAGFDSMLWLHGVDNNGTTGGRINGDDDSGGNYNPQYCSVSRNNDIFVVRVYPYRDGEGGAYTISVTDSPLVR